MSRIHRHKIYLGIADSEIEVEVDFTLSPRVPEQGPTYASGGQPAEGGEIAIVEANIWIADKIHPCPDWLSAIIANDDGLIQKLAASVSVEDEGPDADAAYDRRRDEREAA